MQVTGSRLTGRVLLPGADGKDLGIVFGRSCTQRDPGDSVLSLKNLPLSIHTTGE